MTQKVVQTYLKQVRKAFEDNFIPGKVVSTFIKAYHSRGDIDSLAQGRLSHFLLLAQLPEPFAKRHKNHLSSIMPEMCDEIMKMIEIC